ncbi:MAG: M23 family metallopeptidase [Anaerolineales bacterium]|nr:M23 family metallopeptidase [Anaerolineales bacterium]
MEGNLTKNEPAAPKTAPKKGAILQQIGLNMLMIGLLLVLGFLAWQRFFSSRAGQTVAAPSDASAQLENPPESGQSIGLSPLTTPQTAFIGVTRHTNVNTIIPSRPRVNVITYTVQAGDTLFSIASNYGLKPETVLWGNYEVLNDNPHLLKPSQVLNILPVDGTYYQWNDGDRLSGVAELFQVDQDDIIDYPGNFIDLTQADPSASIEAGSWLIVPGGKRAIKDWGPPAITRENAATARYYGAGACGSIYSGAVGSGTFVWPTTDHTISGYAFDGGVHPAIDIGGQTGNPVYATDSGVVVYAGWSDYGYGNLIAIDHGNGWQSAYAHLSSIGVSCGQSVFQGGYIGALGSTGNSSGPHLHFELMINGAKVNPYDYVR